MVECGGGGVGGFMMGGGGLGWIQIMVFPTLVLHGRCLSELCDICDRHGNLAAFHS